MEDKISDVEIVLNERILGEKERDSLPTTTSTSSTTAKIPIPVFQNKDDDFEDVLNTIFQSA